MLLSGIALKGSVSTIRHILILELLSVDKVITSFSQKLQAKREQIMHSEKNKRKKEI